MNIDHILDVFNRHEVSCILIGGMNFFLRHKPTLTFDIDFWIEDNNDNIARCEQALIDLNVSWGTTDEDWGPVSKRKPTWLISQSVFCMTSPYGAIDIFRQVSGLSDWQQSKSDSILEKTAGGISYFGLSDRDMLNCQLAISPNEQKVDRMDTLRKIIEAQNDK